MTPRATYHKWGLLLSLLLVPLCALGQQSDKELLREATFAAPKEDRTVEYGMIPDHSTFSPRYHLASGAMWLWENQIAPEVCSPGGYTESNTAYFKALVEEYGSFATLFLSFDRIVRNTRIGRHSTPTNNLGLIEDDPKRYRQ
jgi:hypothetical protein